jgi:membrane protease YdiL (CAAX protease family)
MIHEESDFGNWVRGIPRLTIGNLAIALFALPLVALLELMLPIQLAPTLEIALQGLVAGTVIGFAVRLEECTLNDIGFQRPTIVDFVYVIGTTVAALLVFAGTDPFVSALGLPVTDGASAVTAGVGVGLAFVTAVTIGVVEEILYRGYAIERLNEYVESPAIAGGISWGTFTIAHAVVWPVGNLIQVATVAAVFTLVYLRRRSLFPVVSSHVLVWCLAVLGQVYA